MAKTTKRKRAERRAIDLSGIPELTAQQRAGIRPRAAKTRRVAFSLAQIRRAFRRTQVQVSAEAGMPQANVSKIECREDLDVVVIATLRKYLRGIGGDLELVATFRTGHRFVIRMKQR